MSRYETQRVNESKKKYDRGSEMGIWKHQPGIVDDNYNRPTTIQSGCR